MICKATAVVLAHGKGILIPTIACLDMASHIWNAPGDLAKVEIFETRWVDEIKLSPSSVSGSQPPNPKERFKHESDGGVLGVISRKSTVTAS